MCKSQDFEESDRQTLWESVLASMALVPWQEVYTVVFVVVPGYIPTLYIHTKNPGNMFFQYFYRTLGSRSSHVDSFTLRIRATHVSSYGA